MQEEGASGRRRSYGRSPRRRRPSRASIPVSRRRWHPRSLAAPQEGLEIRDELDGRFLNVFLVTGLVLCEPFPGVVVLQVAKEREQRGRERGRRHGSPWFADTAQYRFAAVHHRLVIALIASVLAAAACTGGGER